MSEQTTPPANNNAISQLATVDSIPANEGTSRANRDEEGHFLPGNCENPTGRPVIKHITDAIKEQLRKVAPDDTSGAQRLAKKLMAHADNDKDGYLSLAAIKEIIDRTEGKAVQNTNVRALMVMVPPDAVIDAAFAGEAPSDDDSDE